MIFMILDSPCQSALLLFVCLWSLLFALQRLEFWHYSGVMMGTMVSQITSLTIVYLTIYSGADQRKHRSFASLAYVWAFHWWPVNFPHKWPVTRKMFPYDDVIMCDPSCSLSSAYSSGLILSLVCTNYHQNQRVCCVWIRSQESFIYNNRKTSNQTMMSFDLDQYLQGHSAITLQ